MASNKEADLTTAVLLYAMRCLAEGDQQALRMMNFGPKELDALKDMNLADLYRVDNLGAHCLQVDLNRDVFWPMLDNLRHQRESEELQRELIVADAPMEMMQVLFGISSREYTRWRRVLTVSPSVGRPPEPDEAATHNLWYAWQGHFREGEETSLAGADYLSLQQETNIGLRAIWTLIQRWEVYGHDEHGADAKQVIEHGQ
ncbi:MAG: DUF2857 domain-containing protein [Gammaproteobacteria bacterium]|nr:DUF2857 domain-containing protein [Gammaproteobacteria bacterium]